MKAEKFDDIRPYYDSEIPSAMSRISQDPNFEMLTELFFPNKSLSEMKATIQRISSIHEFQTTIMYPVLLGVMQRSVNEFTHTGITKLSKDKNYIYISNHRDIVLDALLLQKALIENGLETTEVTFGSNLMSTDFIIDIGKSNKMFKVIRSASPRDFLHNSRHLSNYLRYTLTKQKHSIWIAQRNGRTKDGLDRTDQGLIKMFSMSGPKDFVPNIDELNLLPVSISYEFEPCDFLKVRELYIARRRTYRKTREEDLNSIITGITQHKGRIHIEVSEPVSVEELKQIDLLINNQKFDALAKLVDYRIVNSFKLWNTNYIAADILSGGKQYKTLYSDTEREDFTSYMNHQLSKISDINDSAELTKLFLELYANPVISKQLIAE